MVRWHVHNPREAGLSLLANRNDGSRWVDFNYRRDHSRDVSSLLIDVIIQAARLRDAPALTHLTESMGMEATPSSPDLLFYDLIGEDAPMAYHGPARLDGIDDRAFGESSARYYV